MENIWSLNVPRKVRTFIWRACSNILPIRANLHQRKLQIDPKCEVYCQHAESVAHFLRECPFARNVWALCRAKIQKLSNVAQEFLFLFRYLLNKLPCQELEQWAMISWVIWNAQNRFFFEKFQDHPKSILAGLLTSWGNIRGLQLLKQTSNTD